jgi:hypothetical protein
MNQEKENVTYMDDYYPAKLSHETIDRIQKLEKEISSEFGDHVILMAFTPKRESWGDY